MASKIAINHSEWSDWKRKKDKNRKHFAKDYPCKGSRIGTIVLDWIRIISNAIFLPHFHHR